jgi:DNA mismatch repair protein MutS
VNVHLTATEHEDSIIFLHHVKDGPASQSYGLQVAKLAGVPDSVIVSAKKRLRELEAQGAESDLTLSPVRMKDEVEANSPTQQSDLFATQTSEVERELAELALDELSPKQALDALYQLKTLMH